MDVSDKITRSSKYRRLDKTVVDEVVSEFGGDLAKDKLVEKKVKNLLHQAWGAFYPVRPNFIKLKQRLTDGLDRGEGEKALLKEILRAHASTYERLGYLDDFYAKIFAITGKPSSILDLGCGLNPLTIPWMRLDKECSYIAVDIDRDQMGFIKEVADLFDWVVQPSCVVKSAFSEDFEPADVIFMFKLITVLDKLKRKFDLADFLAGFSCKYFVITFPSASLSGRNVGMTGHYSNLMSDFFAAHPYEHSVFRFPGELVYKYFLINK